MRNDPLLFAHCLLHGAENSQKHSDVIHAGTQRIIMQRAALLPTNLPSLILALIPILTPKLYPRRRRGLGFPSIFSMVYEEHHNFLPRYCPFIFPSYSVLKLRPAS